MLRSLITISLLGLAGFAQAQSPTNCALVTAPAGMAIQPTMLPALSPELVVPRHQLGAPTGVLAQAFDESQSVDNVLFRMKVEGCRSLANATPAASPGAAPAAGVIDPSTYKPQTQFDNTPWRFDMNQNGKRMTAEEFDQWMKARGVRVAKGGSAPAAAPAPVGATPGATAPGATPAAGTTADPTTTAPTSTAPVNTAPATTTPATTAPTTTPPAAPPGSPPGTLPTTTTTTPTPPASTPN